MKNTKKFQASISDWSKNNLREFPWRETKTSAYQILVAEMLLKRTTAKAAATVYPKLIKKYPDVIKLAAAKENELVNLLAAIGYPQRSKEMVAAAKFIVSSFHSKIPDKKNELLSIPFVGEYISNAILSMAFSKPFPMVDSNFNRIICRVCYGTNPTPNVTKEIRNAAEELLPQVGHKGFNLAMLDIGGTICHPRSPKCSVCPLATICIFQKKKGLEIPVSRKN